jgi:hypothetical protein
LFEECYRQGILTSEFFLDDDRFIGNVPVKADAELQKSFIAACKRSQDLALFPAELAKPRNWGSSKNSR